MGWFDHDTKEKPKEEAPTAAAPASPPRPAAAAAAPAPPATPKSGGSRLGERVHINGTIVCEEDLTIIGKVEGTIHSGQLLLVSKEADVKAVIHGRRVMLEGTVTGDVHGSETVVLGPTAQLTGNIHTPALQIREGAFFKGNVEMQVPARDKAAPKGKPATAETQASTAKPPAQQQAASAQPAKSAAPEAPSAGASDNAGGQPQSSSASSAR